MSRPIDVPVVDHHCHLSPSGEGVEAVRRFARAGGSHLFLATQNYRPEVPVALDDYLAQFDETEAMARRIRAETGVIAYPVLAPFPVDLVGQSERLGLRGAVDLQHAALQQAAHRVEEQRAVALGEVGRPHFPVAAELAEAANEVLMYALESARDVGCPVVLHSEDLGPPAYRGLAQLASEAAFPLGKLVKHYARTVYAKEELAGVVPSYLARREVVDASLAHPGPWFWETDFLDDPRRPGAVLDLATIPRRAAAVAAAPGESDKLRIPFVDSVERVYGFIPVRAGAGGA